MLFSTLEQDSVQYSGGIEVVVDTNEPRLVEESNKLIQLLGASPPNPEHAVYFGKRGIELRASNKINHKGQRVDFSTIDRRIGAGNLSKNQPLPKSIGAHTTLVDATAGFGFDAIRLVLMGYKVVAVEQSPIIAAMLRDGLWRAEKDVELSKAIGGCLSLAESNSVQYLQSASSSEVVYIDPMFPPKRKKSALPPGHIQALQAVVGYDKPNQTQLLFETALKTATKRVVVKRPPHAPQLGPNPVAIHAGKLVRYEVYKPTGV